MWANSMMNLPSLYFWLDSNACSYVNLNQFKKLFQLENWGKIYIFPAEGRLAALAVNVGHGVQSGQQDPLFRRTAAHVHPEGT